MGPERSAGAELAAVVQEPTPAGPPPSAPTWTIFEGTGRAGPRRWVTADVPPGVPAAEVLRDARAAAGAAPAAVALTARPLGNWTSTTFSPDRVSHVMPVAIAAPADEVDDVDRWYEDEHAAMLLRCPAWLRVRRYAIASIDGAGWSRLALHDLASGDVLSSPEVRAAMATPWRTRLAARPWFLTEGRGPYALCR